MPRRPSATRRWITAMTWPAGIAVTAWDYLWRSTPLHRREWRADDGPNHHPPRFPAELDASEVQGTEAGVGPLFHRRYATVIREIELGPDALFARLAEDLDRAAPTAFARFHKVFGEPGQLRAGDEYVVRMPGPWDGPVRVIHRTPRSFRLATLDGHLEAGQLEFRVADAGPGRVRFEIESWARSSSRVTNLLYHRLRMAKEIQFHMWISFLEGVVTLAGGRMTGGIEALTERVEHAAP